MISTSGYKDSGDGITWPRGQKPELYRPLLGMWSHRGSQQLPKILSAAKRRERELLPLFLSLTLQFFTMPPTSWAQQEASLTEEALEPKSLQARLQLQRREQRSVRTGPEEQPAWGQHAPVLYYRKEMESSLFSCFIFHMLANCHCLGRNIIQIPNTYKTPNMKYLEIS